MSRRPAAPLRRRSGPRAGRIAARSAWLLSLVAVAALAAGAAGETGETGEASAAGPPGTVLDVSGLTFVGSRDADNEVVLRAVHARFHPETNRAELEQVHAVVSGTDDEPGFEMTCDRADLDLDSNDFRAEGHVVGSTASGRRFRSSWVQYDSDEGLLYTEAPVTIQEQAGTLRGGGFRYHVREKRFRLLGGATMVQEP